MGEAADRDCDPHSLPTDAFDEREQHLFKRDAVEGVAGLGQGQGGGTVFAGRPRLLKRLLPQPQKPTRSLAVSRRALLHESPPGRRP